MDFLTLFISYLFILTVVLVVYCFSGSRVIRQSFTLLEDYMWPIFPRQCKDLVLTLVDWLLYKRNPLYQTLYCTFTAMGHMILFIDVLPYLYAMQPDTNHTFVPMMLLLVTAIFFSLCSWTDPGLIWKDNLRKYRDTYRFDDVIYQNDTICEDCKMKRPARARHCVICNKCVLRYDHHCLWTNSCIGFYNHRYFLCLLVAIVSSGGYSVFLSLQVLWSITIRSNLLSAKYIDAEGKHVDMTTWTVIQYLFFEYPRIVMLIAGVGIIVLILIIFFVFHLYLVITNQTTYEKNKRGIQNLGGRNIYHQGLWRNIKEVFSPSLRTARKNKNR